MKIQTLLKITAHTLVVSCNAAFSQQKKYKQVNVVWQLGNYSMKQGGAIPGDTIKSDPVDCSGIKLIEPRVILAHIPIPEEAWEFDRIIFSLSKEGEYEAVNPFYKDGFGEAKADLKAQMIGQKYYSKYFGYKDYCKKEEYVARIYVSVQSITGYEEKIVNNTIVKKPVYSKVITIAESNPITLGSKKKKD